MSVEFHDNRGKPATWLVASAGEMGRMIATHSWCETTFGPLERWPANLRAMVNLMLGGAAPMALVWGEEYRLLYNDAYREIIKDKHPQALGERCEVIFSETWDQLRAWFEQAYRGEAVTLDDISIELTRGGETKEANFSGSYTPVRNEAGGVDGFFAVVLESTARLQAERDRAKVFDTTLSAIVDFAYSFDREGRFRYVNKALLDLWGMKLEQAVGKNFHELNYPPELATRLQAQIEQVFREKTLVRDETRYVNPAGVEGYYEYIFSPVVGANGAVELVAGSTRDITGRVKLERDLRDVHARLASTVEAGAIGTWSWDVAADRLVADRTLARFFSVSEADANGGRIENYMRAIHPEDRDYVAEKIQEALENRANYEVEYRLLDADGSVRWVVARASVIRNAEGKAITVPGMVIDITERKRLEQRLQETIEDLRGTQLALEKQTGELERQVKERTARLQETVSELETFSYSISHDLRGPLRIMRSFAEALREDCGAVVGPAGEDYIRRIVGASTRLDRIIQDVLVYSRVARTELKLERVELDGFVRGILEHHPALHGQQADIVVEGPMPAVQASPAALTQCFTNLLGNALKFVAKGTKPAVKISAQVIDGRAYVSVSDNGIGIPKKAQEAIFNVFYRHEAGYEGTGIGLAIVRKAIERLGGKITVVSEPGRGSTFTFDLSLAEAP